jgi:cytochrome oxidase Cu insertion factor (SCO1/SenC/PrrC family)
MQANPEAAIKESEALFEVAAEQYSGIQLPDGETVGERARAELFEIRHLRVGVVAPEIEGEDQHGQTFRLSEYRGKVVLLDFWSHV